jgi:hypothetical protein
MKVRVYARDDGMYVMRDEAVIGRPAGAGSWFRV